MNERPTPVEETEGPLIWLMAGETSGDAYGAEIARGLRKKFNGKIRIAGMGREQMREAGVKLLVDSAELGIMGFLEVFKMLFTFIRTFKFLERRAKQDQPDMVVLIDYPGFNLRFAKRLHAMGIPVVWYISPKVWAWGKGRIPTLAKVCRKVMCIFPFEPEYFKDKGVNTAFVGHPLVNMIRSKIDTGAPRDPDILLILPGSRKGEIKYLLPPMLRSLQKLWLRHRNLRFVIAAANPKTEKQIRTLVQKFSKTLSADEMPEFDIRLNETYHWIERAGTALATSGTVTVECAIAGLPLVSIYASSYFNFYMAMWLVKLYRDFFTMPNIIMDKCVYEEYMQYCLHPYVLVPALERILPGGERRDWVIAETARMTDLLAGGTDNAISRAVDTIADELTLAKKEKV